MTKRKRPVKPPPATADRGATPEQVAKALLQPAKPKLRLMRKPRPA